MTSFKKVQRFVKLFVICAFFSTTLTAQKAIFLDYERQLLEIAPSYFGCLPSSVSRAMTTHTQAYGARNYGRYPV